MREIRLAVVPPPRVTGNPSIVIPLDFLIISGFAVAIACGVGIIKVFIGREMAGFEDRFSRLEADQKQVIQKIDGLDKTVSQLETKVASGYVSNEDWIRAQSVTDSKLDSFSRRIDQVLALMYEAKK